MARTQKRVQEGNREEKHIVYKVSPSTLKYLIKGISTCWVIILISIGAIYLDECPIQWKLPIYLIVFGGIQMTITLIIGHDIKNDLLKKGICFFRTIIIVFLFIWYSLGHRWIYTTDKPNYSKNATDVNSYCNKTFYLFTFWTNRIIMGPLVVLIAICGLPCYSKITTYWSKVIRSCNTSHADDDISGNSAEKFKAESL